MKNTRFRGCLTIRPWNPIYNKEGCIHIALNTASMFSFQQKPFAYDSEILRFFNFQLKKVYPTGGLSA